MQVAYPSAPTRSFLHKLNPDLVWHFVTVHFWESWTWQPWRENCSLSLRLSIFSLISFTQRERAHRLLGPSPYLTQ